MRESWTDDRMDDLAKRVDTGFTQVHDDIAGLGASHQDLRSDMAALNRDLRTEISQLATREELHSEIGTLRSETRQGFDALNHRFDALQRTLIAGILAGFIGLIVTHFG
jgi:archaellum component FlaC